MEEKQNLIYLDYNAVLNPLNKFRCLDNDTHVYYFDTENLKPEQANFITEEERERADRFFQKQDKLNFLYGRHLTRTLLGKYYNLSADEIGIRIGLHKKPYAVIFNDESPSKIKFNISHSANGLLIAFSKNEVGCDIEAIADTNYKDLMESIYTKEETKFVIKSSNPLKSFFKIWARKEAVLKAAGIGLINDLTQLEVCNDVNAVRSSELQLNGNYYLTGFQIENKFSAAVCITANEKSTTLFFDGGAVLKGNDGLSLAL